MKVGMKAKDKAFLNSMASYMVKGVTGCQNGLSKTAFAVLGNAQKLCAVKTGKLRRSINVQFSDDKMAASIGTNVFYGPFVEGIAIPRGKKAFKATPFLRPSFMNEIPRMAQENIIPEFLLQVRT